MKKKSALILISGGIYSPVAAKILKENGYTFECLETQRIFFEELYIYLVKEKA